MLIEKPGPPSIFLSPSRESREGTALLPSFPFSSREISEIDFPPPPKMNVLPPPLGVLELHKDEVLFPREIKEDSPLLLLLEWGDLFFSFPSMRRDVRLVRGIPALPSFNSEREEKRAFFLPPPPFPGRVLGVAMLFPLPEVGFCYRRSTTRTLLTFFFLISKYTEGPLHFFAAVDPASCFS